MANASMRQLSQFGKEVTYGTPVVTGMKRFTSFGLAASPNMGVATATPRGQTTATQGWISREDSSFSIEGGVLSYDEVVYLLESVCKVAGAATTTGTTGKQRIYTIDQFVADTFQSYTIQNGFFGSPNRVYQANGATVNEWGFEVSSTDDTIGMTGSLVGWQLATQGSPATGTATPYTVAIPKQFTLGYAATGTGLSSATNVTNAFTAGFNISDRRSLVRYLGNATGNPSDVVETTPGLSFNLTLADETAPVDTFLTNARAGSKQFFRLKGTGAVIGAGPATYSFQLDISTVLSDSPSVSDQDGVQVVTFPYTAAYDSTWGKIFEITTVNALTDPL